MKPAQSTFSTTSPLKVIISIVLLELEISFMNNINYYKKYTDKLIDKMCEILKTKGKEVKPTVSIEIEEEEKQEEIPEIL